jgi:hydrogenase maturation factor HypF (carbamoyltransferase family)
MSINAVFAGELAELHPLFRRQQMSPLAEAAANTGICDKCHKRALGPRERRGPYVHRVCACCGRLFFFAG